jgi:predicted enzyme related to lactoylglutathione lyase
MPRPTHFEIPAENTDRAIAFYQTVFGWKFQKWDGPMPYWLIITGDDSEPGINGGLLPRHDPAQPCVNTVTVKDLDGTLATVTSQGGVCVLPRMAIPGVGWLAYCKDTESNMFGMMQPDAGAK